MPSNSIRRRKIVVSKRSSEGHDISLRKESKEMVHMIRSFLKGPMVSFEKIAALTLVLSLMGVQAAFSAVGGIPGPPIVTPPPPPCISTGLLAEVQTDTSVGCYTCYVRNVGTVSHNVSTDIRDAGNLTDSGTIPLTVAPGHSTGATFCPSANNTASDACVVTTDEGTTDALQDLAVVLQFDSPAGETEGKIFNSCAARDGIANRP
jgi:hypothetical protein